MHRLFSDKLEKYEVKPNLTEAIKIALESTYHELNKDSVEKEMINEAVILCQNLCQLWQDGSIALKEGLQNLLFPSSLVYYKKNGAFRASEINFIITQVALHTGDLALIKKGLSSIFESKSLFAEREGFEPSVQLPVRMFSKHVHSASLASLLLYLLMQNYK